MAIELIQSTASQEIPLGPFLDETDGITPLTGLTIANTDIKLWKRGATTLANKNSGGATHISGGVYYAVLDATDTGTDGPMVIFCHPSGALPVRVECDVKERVRYYKELNYWWTLAYAQATGTPTTTTVPITLAYPTADASSTDDEYIGQMLLAVAKGPGFTGGFVTRVSDYNGTTKTLTVDPPFPSAPSNGDYFFMMAGAPGALAASVVSSIQSGLATAAALATVDGIVDDILVDTGTTLPATLATLATAAALDTVDNLVDDLETRLTATRAGYLDNLNSGVTLTAGAIDAIIDEVIEGSTTLRQALRLILSVAVGKSAGGGGSTITFRDLADSKNRISATVDGDGNRTAVTRDAS